MDLYSPDERPFMYWYLATKVFVKQTQVVSQLQHETMHEDQPEEVYYGYLEGQLDLSSAIQDMCLATCIVRITLLFKLSYKSNV